MSRVVGCGIDFGTSNSSVAVARSDGSVEVIRVGSGDMPYSLPSVVYLHRDGNRLAGGDAVEEFLITGAHKTLCSACSLVVPDLHGHYSDCRHYRPGGGCNDARLMYGLKSELSNEEFRTTHSWATDFEMPDLVAVVIRHLKTLAESQSGEEITRVVIGAPVAFVGTEGPRFFERQELAETRLVESAYAAGFKEVDIFYEPAAAVIDQPLDPGYSIALDFGGGTFDVGVIYVAPDSDEAEIVALQGAAVGGVVFDGLIFDEVVAEQIGVDGRLPHRMRRALRTLMGVRQLLTDPTVRGALAQLRAQGQNTAAIEGVVFGGQAYSFYRAIENAKIELSRSDAAKIAFRRPGIHVDATITRRQFEALIEPHMKAVRRAVENALSEAGIEPEQIHTVIRTGGTSELPAFLHLVQRVFPQATVRKLPVFTAVAEGLGKEAVSRFGHVQQ